MSGVTSKRGIAGGIAHLAAVELHARGGSARGDVCSLADQHRPRQARLAQARGGAQDALVLGLGQRHPEPAPLDRRLARLDDVQRAPLFSPTFHVMHAPCSMRRRQMRRKPWPSCPTRPRSIAASRTCTSSAPPTTFIDGKAGELRYRGYSIHDLAQHSTFEETAYLLLHGELPKASELAQIHGRTLSRAPTAAAVLDIIAAVQRAHPMDVLRTAVSALSAFDPETGDKSRAATLRKGMRLTAQVPMIVAAHARIREGKAPVAPDAGLSHAANFLWMLKGEKPSEDAARLHRHRPGAARRARLQRVLVRCPRRRRHAGRHPCRRHGRGRGAVRPRARRRGRGRAGAWPRRSASRQTSPPT